MKRSRCEICLIGLVALIGWLGTASGVNAQEKPLPFLSREQGSGVAGDSEAEAKHIPAQRCRGPITRVMDVGFEDVKTTSYNWSTTGGGGESGRYDKTPVLSTSVTLLPGSCLDAHFSAIVGSRQTYGSGVSSIAMFQVTLTPATGGLPQHMVGHYETPYGQYGPAVAIEAEHDVDTFSSNFFQRVGSGAGDVPPGTYKVDVWWSGGPVGGGGAIGADFILKLYMR
jgi:hypothetical protein